jgi:hypothetical protein
LGPSAWPRSRGPRSSRASPTTSGAASGSRPATGGRAASTRARRTILGAAAVREKNQKARAKRALGASRGVGTLVPGSRPPPKGERGRQRRKTSRQGLKNRRGMGNNILVDARGQGRKAKTEEFFESFIEESRSRVRTALPRSPEIGAGSPRTAKSRTVARGPRPCPVKRGRRWDLPLGRRTQTKPSQSARFIIWREDQNFFGEFDHGSGRTLAACLKHASRTRGATL